MTILPESSSLWYS